MDSPPNPTQTQAPTIVITVLPDGRPSMSTNIPAKQPQMLLLLLTKVMEMVLTQPADKPSVIVPAGGNGHGSFATGMLKRMGETFRRSA